MNLRPAILCAAAGFAGWWGMAWWEAAHMANRTDTTQATPVAVPSPDSVSAKAVLQSIRRPVAGSAELSRIAALIAGIPDAGLADAQAHVEKWPPGTARAFAMALLNERKPREDAPEDPSASAGTETKPPYNRYRELAAAMATGEIMSAPGLHRGTYHDIATLEDWVRLDPVAATDAVLKMPRDGRSRSAAVDTTVKFLAKTDPAAAMEFFFKCGEKHLGRGTADAWMKLVLRDERSDDRVDAQRQFLDRMSGAQHDSLFAEIASSLQSRDVSDPLPDSELNRLALCVLQTGEATPGLESFFEELTDYPQAAGQVKQLIETCQLLSPVHQKALEILLAHEVETSPAARLDADDFIQGDSFDSSYFRVEYQPLLDRVAPSIISKLATSDRLPEAVELLDRIHDPDARRTSLEALLPYWMATDPAAARAAFNAAPLTALERERWQRHPAFLRHP